MHAPQKQNSQQQRMLMTLQKQIQELRNEMEFVEILVQFWPWSNMSHKMERLEKKLNGLTQQCLLLQSG
jgi:hypothetical protein